MYYERLYLLVMECFSSGFLFLVGYVIGFLISMIMVWVLIPFLYNKYDKYGTGRIYELLNNYRMGNLGYLYHKWGEFFKSMSMTFGMSRSVKFRYYGGTWLIINGSTLYWVHSKFRGEQNETPEYKSSWNYWRNDFRSMKYIMENHPNLQRERKNLSRVDSCPKLIPQYQAGDVCILCDTMTKYKPKNCIRVNAL